MTAESTFSEALVASLNQQRSTFPNSGQKPLCDVILRCGGIATGWHSWATFRDAVFTAMPGILENMVTGWWHGLPLHAPMDNETANPNEGASMDINAHEGPAGQESDQAPGDLPQGTDRCRAGEHLVKKFDDCHNVQQWNPPYQLHPV